jgi:hypothetical protein
MLRISPAFPPKARFPFHPEIYSSGYEITQALPYVSFQSSKFCFALRATSAVRTLDRVRQRAAAKDF